SILGERPWPHHALQGILLAVSATLAFSLVWRLSKDRLLPFVFLLLFLTYPNRGEAYFWPAAVYVPLLLALLAGLHFGLTWLETGGRAMYAACWLAYSAAVFTHEAAFGFLGIFAALWLLQRGRAASWRDGARFLIPLAATNAAYLAVRQTRWFGIGDPRYLFQRRLQLQPAAFFGNLLYSFRVNFGAPFIENVQNLMRNGSHGMLWFTFLAMLAALIGAAALFGERRGGIRLHLEGALMALAAILAVALYTEQAPVPELSWILKVALRMLALLALGALVKLRLSPAAVNSELPRLAAFGCFWFLAAYAPAWVSGVADRHSYLPSVGACLLLAVALLLPAGSVREGRERQLLEGVALGLAALICVAFYAACLGEGDRWVKARRFTSRLQDQILAARLSLPAEVRVVILAMPPAREMLPGYALEAAVQHWYRSAKIRAGREFTPGKREFQFVYSGTGQPYDWLLLFTYDGKVLAQVKYLVFEDGTKARLGAALNGASAGSDGDSLAVVAGQLVGHYIRIRRG
ncbi:MAG TPA: hypothetical protein VEU62_06765, partial [Bryobacterales bacterium]|nr:hypothetical protein [Bryobacterales bacterium]